MAMKKLGAIIVVGVSSSPGLGLSIAKRFAREGKRVGIIGRSEEKLKLCKLAIEGHGGEKYDVTYRNVDCGNRTALHEALDSIHSELCSDECSLQGVIFNASPRPFPLQKVAETEYDRLVSDLNTSHLGFLNCSSWGVEKMLGTLSKRSPDAQTEYTASYEKKGVILVTGATASLRGSADFGAFCASKAGIRSLAQSLAKETLRAGLHVGHVVVDGVVEIDLINSDKFERGRLMDPDAIADAYWYLFSQPLNCLTFEMDMRPSMSKWT